MKENYAKTQTAYSITHRNQFQNYAQENSCKSFLMILAPTFLSQVFCQFRKKILSMSLLTKFSIPPIQDLTE
jgi:hypothetical protein